MIPPQGNVERRVEVDEAAAVVSRPREQRCASPAEDPRPDDASLEVPSTAPSARHQKICRLRRSHRSYDMPACGAGGWGLGTGDWGLGTGDWGLGTGDWGLEMQPPSA
ncbi:MAG: hypothetical protein QM811_01295 [Pirellulales bacterium]